MIFKDSRIIEMRSTAEMESVLFKDGLLQVLPFAEIQKFDSETIRVFLHKFGVYVLPTTELIGFLKTEIVGSAIEIGCGTGAVGRALGIPITDLCLQESPEIKFWYESNGQPTIKYPRDVIKLEAQSAIARYKPQTVIGCYITHKWNGKSGSTYGIVEGKILSEGCKYINVGNDNIHHNKPLQKHPHRTLRFDWLVTRSEPVANHIKIWDNGK